MNWNEVPTQVLRDLWVSRFGEVFTVGEMYWTLTNPEWEPVHAQLAARRQLVWYSVAAQTMQLREVKDDT